MQVGQVVVLEIKFCRIWLPWCNIVSYSRHVPAVGDKGNTGDNG